MVRADSSRYATMPNRLRYWADQFRSGRYTHPDKIAGIARQRGEYLAFLDQKQATCAPMRLWPTAAYFERKSK